MTKWIILSLVTVSGLLLWLLPQRKVEETEYQPYGAKVGVRKIILSLAGSYTQAGSKIIKGAPYRLSVYFASPQHDEIAAINVSNLSIVSENGGAEKLSFSDKGEKIGRLNTDKSYYWLIAYDGLTLPAERSRLSCEIRVESKDAKVERENVEWSLVPVRTEYHVNAIVEAIKGM